MRSEEEVLARLAVDPAVGLSSQEAAELLERHGPNALPAEQSVPGWRRFLGQYRSYMQIILVAAAIVSLAIKEWSTGVLLLLITVLNAAVGLRQEGKAESAMNALKAMVKATARVRRGGSEAEIPAEEVVVGDVVLLAAGDDVPADGRIVEASSLQIDESALTGESVPASKGVERPRARICPRRPDRHGLHAHARHARQRRDDRHRHQGARHRWEDRRDAGQHGQGADAADAQLNTLTLWIAAAAGITMVIMFVLGAQRGQSATVVFTSAVALAIAAIPEAMPTVLQVSCRSAPPTWRARRGAEGPGLGRDAGLDLGDQLGQDRDADDEPDDGRRGRRPDRPLHDLRLGYELEGTVHHAAGSSDTIDDAILPYVIASDAKLVEGKVVGDPTEGALLVLAHKAGLDLDATRERYPRLATLPFDPTYKLMAAFTKTSDASGKEVVRCFVKGAAPAVMSHAASALSAGQSIPWDEDLRTRAQANVQRMEEDGLRVMAGGFRDLDPGVVRSRRRPAGLREALEITSLVGMVDPPRAESRQAVEDAQSAHIRVRMVTGDDVITGAAIAKQLGIDGEAMLGAEFAALDESERLDADRADRRRRPGRSRAQGAARRHAQAEGRGRRDDRRRRQRRALDQGRAHRHRDGQRHRGRQERRPHDPHRRQLRHDRARRRGRAASSTTTSPSTSASC